jgi:CheY-like chemotaxis protein
MPRILLVDHHEDTCTLPRIFLTNHGYSVSYADNVAEGVSMARAGAFDMYLAESRFPDGKGLDLCRLIREFDSNTPLAFFMGEPLVRIKRGDCERRAGLYLSQTATTFPSSSTKCCIIRSMLSPGLGRRIHKG